MMTLTCNFLFYNVNTGYIGLKYNMYTEEPRLSKLTGIASKSDESIISLVLHLQMSLLTSQLAGEMIVATIAICIYRLANDY